MVGVGSTGSSFGGLGGYLYGQGEEEDRKQKEEDGRGEEQRGETPQIRKGRIQAQAWKRQNHRERQEERKGTESPKARSQGVDVREAGKAAESELRNRPEEAADRVAHAETRNIFAKAGDLQAVVQEMEDAAALSDRCETPVYHLGVSWPEEDDLTTEERVEITEEVLEDIGLGDRQALIVEHSDGRPHTHAMVNRIQHDPSADDYGKAWSSWKHWQKIECSLRRIEKERGLRRVPGKLAETPDLEQEPGESLSEGQVQILKDTGELPLVEQIRTYTEGHFEEAEGWGDLQKRLSAYGLRAEPKGSGGVVREVRSGEAVKLSSVGRDFSHPKLEERFGEGLSEWKDRTPEPERPDPMNPDLDPIDADRLLSGRSAETGPGTKSELETNQGQDAVREHSIAVQRAANPQPERETRQKVQGDTLRRQRRALRRLRRLRRLQKEEQSRKMIPLPLISQTNKRYEQLERPNSRQSPAKQEEQSRRERQFREAKPEPEWRQEPAGTEAEAGRDRSAGEAEGHRSGQASGGGRADLRGDRGPAGEGASTDRGVSGEDNRPDRRPESRGREGRQESAKRHRDAAEGDPPDAQEAGPDIGKAVRDSEDSAGNRQWPERDAGGGQPPRSDDHRAGERPDRRRGAERAQRGDGETEEDLPGDRRADRGIRRGADDSGPVGLDAEDSGDVDVGEDSGLVELPGVNPNESDPLDPSDAEPFGPREVDVVGKEDLPGEPIDPDLPEEEMRQEARRWVEKDLGMSLRTKLLDRGERALGVEDPIDEEKLRTAETEDLRDWRWELRDHKSAILDRSWGMKMGWSEVPETVKEKDHALMDEDRVTTACIEQIGREIRRRPSQAEESRIRSGLEEARRLKGKSQTDFGEDVELQRARALDRVESRLKALSDDQQCGVRKRIKAHRPDLKQQMDKAMSPARKSAEDLRQKLVDEEIDPGRKSYDELVAQREGGPSRKSFGSTEKEKRGGTQEDRGEKGQNGKDQDEDRDTGPDRSKGRGRRGRGGRGR